MGAVNARFEMLHEESADETASVPIDCRGMAHLAIYTTVNGTVTSGVITIETADIPPDVLPSTFTGAWSLIGTIDPTAPAAGAQLRTAITTGAYADVRTRISTVIGGGGSVSTVLIGTQ